jgi:hypothetical protein
MASENSKTKNGGDLGFEAELFKVADKLRGNMEPSDYKHVVLGLIFLKYISDAFDTKYQALMTEDPAFAEERDEYAADNVFWVPKEARWNHLQANAKLPTIGTLIDDAMRLIEKDNESLKGVLPKDYARPALNKIMLGELIDLISGIALNESSGASKDVLGRVYEYFLGQFAGAEGKRGGEFYTPRSGDFLRDAIGLHGLLEKAHRGLLVSLGRQQKVDRLACLVDCAVKVFPNAFDQYVGLVHAPTLTHCALVFTEHFFQQRQETNRPPVDG